MKEEDDLKNKFFLAKSSFKKAKFVILGVKFDKGQTGKRGSSIAPSLLRQASWELEDYSFFFEKDLNQAKIFDAGDIKPKNLKELEKKIKSFFKKIKKTKIPIILGGEHTISYFCFKEIQRFYPKLSWVSFDAHLDLRESYQGSKFNHACTAKRIFDLTKNIVEIGIRTGSQKEWDFMKKNKIKVFLAWEIDFKKIEKVLNKFKHIYLSLDMDVFDPCFCPGVATPEPFGLHPQILIEFLKKFSQKIVAFDLVEIVKDPTRITPILGAKIIMEFIAAKIKKKS